MELSISTPRSALIQQPPKQITSTDNNTMNANSHLTTLPTELLLSIAQNLEKETDLNALIQTSPFFHTTFQETLYKTCSDPQSKFIWACNNNHTLLAEKMLARGATTRIPLVPAKRPAWVLPRLTRDRERERASGPRPEAIPLMAAARNGGVEMVRFLIARDRGLVRLLDGRGFSALCYAVQFGHEDIVVVLLGVDELEGEGEGGLNGDGRSENGDSMRRGAKKERAWKAVNPINVALEWGRSEILKILLEDGRFGFDEGSLLAAVLGAEVECVRVCLEIDTVGEGVDDEYHVFREAELAEACDRGLEDIVLLMLDRARGIDPNRATGRGMRTPLINAARSGHEGVVKILLARDDVDPAKPSRSGCTPFCWAAVKGHVGVMKLLLETGKVDVNSQMDDLRTPLSCAAAAGRQDSVRFLLSLDEVRVESRDVYGRTAISLAAAKGAAGTVRVLLESGRVDPEAKDQIYGFTPLITAIEQGEFHEKPRYDHFDGFLAALPSASQDILNLLRGEDVPVSSGWTRTEISSNDGRESKSKGRDALEVMRVFLACPDLVNPNTSRNDGKTPLMHAIDRRQVDAVQLLLSTSRIDVNITDNNGQTALEYAEEIFRRGQMEASWELDGTPCDLEPVGL
ncbi:hypothetical protein N7533_010914 [Penicillium manginii]|uniref:uncharacterized protein n=1 Tax=Penicillium manginii TaxID=203109 RepID=UPI002549314A|nr:uncharacterized protein N7533_010914 [Penicillium manginii]KAJ5741505.1 hypothetical protein N7533_010914 [Penicillium manginii]